MGRLEWAQGHDPETVPLMLNLHRAQAVAFARARAIWARHGLTAAQFDVLATLRNAAPPHTLTPSELQASVLITSGGLTKVMRQLEAGALVTRPRQNLDQRVKPIRLSRSGKRRIERAMAELALASGTWVREILDAAEIRVLRGLLAKIADGGDPAPP